MRVNMAAFEDCAGMREFILSEYVHSCFMAVVQVKQHQHQEKWHNKLESLGKKQINKTYGVCGAYFSIQVGSNSVLLDFYILKT